MKLEFGLHGSPPWVSKGIEGCEWTRGADHQGIQIAEGCRWTRHADR